MSIEAMKQMVEALEGFYEYGYDRLECYEHITAIKQAIAEAEKQEPVAWLKVNEDSWTVSLDAEPDHIPLYTTPQPKQEPVAWLGFNDRGECREVFTNDMRKMMPNYSIEGMTPVYTTPQQRTWVGLTRDEIQDLLDIVDHYNYPQDLIVYTQAKLKKKNT